jgi:hypothetical protein
MTRSVLVVVAAAAMLALGAEPGLAQSRVFVSGAGSDANPCSVAAPCRTFQQAHNTVAAGGEIVALNPAGYGPLAITKAITVTAIGIEASVTSSSTSPAITIGAGAADVVTLRGLTLFAGATSGDGIDVDSAKSVTIRDCTLSGFAGDGILVDPSANMNIVLRGVSVDNSGNRGLNILPGGSAKLAMLVTDSTFTGNGRDGIGLNASQSTKVTATFNVTAAANIGFGLIVSGSNQPVVMVTGSKLVNNTATGLYGDGPVKVFVDRTQITGNGSAGWFAFNGAVVNSYTDNQVNGNAIDGLNGVVQISSE